MCGTKAMPPGIELPVRTGQLSHIEPGDVVRVKTTMFWEAMNMLTPAGGGGRGGDCRRHLALAAPFALGVQPSSKMNGMNPNPVIRPTKSLRRKSVEIGNALKLAIIAGPCQLESRSHAFDMAGALKETCEKLGVGLVYKTSFDKANRTSATTARGHGAGKCVADLCRHPRQVRPAGSDRRA